MSTQQQSGQSVMVPHPLDADELVEGQRDHERPRADSPFPMVAVEIESGGTWLVPEEDIR